MTYFLLLMGFFGGLMLYLITMVCKDNGKLQNQIDIDKEREKQRQAAKEKDNLSDEDLKKWLEQFKK